MRAATPRHPRTARPDARSRRRRRPAAVAAAAGGFGARASSPSPPPRPAPPPRWGRAWRGAAAAALLAAVVSGGVARAPRAHREARQAAGPAALAERAATARAFVAEQCAATRAKFVAQWWLYCTIPVVAGLLNWATNALAVQMIFRPLEYVGVPLYRKPEVPMGVFGWQGIVPCKTAKMAGTMVELMTTRLLDVREVFGRLDKARCASLLEPGIKRVAAEVAVELTAKGGQLAWAGPVARALPQPAQAALEREAARRGRALVTSVLSEMQERIDEVWDVRGQVVGAMVQNKRILIELFQRCGKSEFVFIQRSGLYFGFLFGIPQMIVWLFWDPWWSLALGGALVGYATDWLALKLMFEPIEPVKLGPVSLQGAFLKRQQEVSGEFAELLRQRVLGAEDIWREILTGTYRDTFYEILRRRTREELTDAAATPLGRAARGVLGAGKWERLEALVVERVVAELPRELPRVYAYSDEALDLEDTLRGKMQVLSSAEFEGVLHPVFQEDELTLILVGTVLGATAGFLQAAFVF